MNRLLPYTVLLVAASAMAQGKPTLADYPLDLKVSVGGDVGKELQDHLRMTLARSRSILVITGSDWKAATLALKRQDCDVRDECLQQLASKAGTLYALYASVERNALGTEITATGRVVNEDGAQARAPIRVTVKKSGSFVEAAKEALGELVSKLDLETLPAAIAKAAPATVKPPDPVMVVQPLPPPVPPPAVEQAMSGQRIGAWVALGGAVVCAGLAAGFGFSSAAQRATLPQDGHLSAAQVPTQQAVNQGAAIALGTGIAAVALAGASAGLFVSSSGEPTSTLTLSLTPNGAALLLSGRF